MKKYQHISSVTKALIIVLLCALKAMAQPYFFRHYQVEHGLSNNAIYCSTQDKKGFMWFGTKDGLNRFDGYHFKTYKTENPKHSLHTDLIYCISPDKNGTLWVGSSKGLFYFDYENEKLMPLIDTLKEVKYIQIDNNNQIWFISAFTLWRYSFKTKKLVEYPMSKYFPASSLSMDVKGQIWVGTRDGFIQKFDARTQTFQKYDVFSHSGKVSSKLIQTIFCLGAETIYVGTVNQGLKKFHIPTETYEDVLIYSKSNNIIHVRDIKPFFPNELWLATESGIFILNTQTNQFKNITKKFLDPFSLTDNAVYSLCKDNEGGIWAGTFFGGVNYYSNLSETHYLKNILPIIHPKLSVAMLSERFAQTALAIFGLVQKMQV